MRGRHLRQHAQRALRHVVCVSVRACAVFIDDIIARLITSSPNKDWPTAAGATPRLWGMLSA